MAASLTKRDLEILDVLTKRIRVMSLQQIARTWWSDASNPTRAAEIRLRVLAKEDLLQIERGLAHPEIELRGPVASWQPGDPPPNFGAVSHQLRARWQLHPVLTPCISASKTGVGRFGGFGGRPPRQVERTHDLHLAQVFLHYRLRNPELVCHWVFEDQIKNERRRRPEGPESGEKLPDVVIRSVAGSRVVEFGGMYAKDKLVSFHGYCKERSFPYEIW